MPVVLPQKPLLGKTHGYTTIGMGSNSSTCAYDIKPIQVLFLQEKGKAT